MKLSKSGRTVYFNGTALKRIERGGISGNHFDLESGDEYWVSGVKRRGTNRHWAGSGVIMIEASAVREYLQLTGQPELDSSQFQVVSDFGSSAITGCDGAVRQVARQLEPDLLIADIGVRNRRQEPYG